MAGQYPYAPPPPPPSATPANGYPSYGQPQSYSHTPPRGGGGGMPVGAGRGRGRDYGSPYGAYHQEYSTPNASPYGHQPSSGYWQGNHQPPNGPPMPQSNYHPNYNPQGYAPQPQTGYQPTAYPPNNQRPSYPPSYNSNTTEYPPPTPQWNETSSPYPPYSNRGGRGGYQGDRGGHRPDHSAGSVIRMGFDPHNTQASNGYNPAYPPPQPHTPYSQPAYNYPPVPAPPYTGSSHHNSYTPNRGRGRDFSQSSRGRSGHNDRGDKFRHRGQRPHHDFNNSSQKSDNASGKKKKRKTNTLGLTPGDGDESEDDSIDEEKHLSDLLGPDAPAVSDVASWISERRGNFPTQARIQAKKAAEDAKRAEVGEDHKPITKVDKDEEKAEKLRRQLAKVERKLEKRKREANDEGDEMRVDGPDSETSDSEDDKPETLTTRQPPPSFLPPPPITRADPKSHCKYYSTGGVCGKKGKCRFVHDPKVREQALREQAANGGRMTLQQRLVRNDKDAEDLAVIQTIVEMRASGRLADKTRSITNTLSSAPIVHPLPVKLEPSSPAMSKSTKPYESGYLGGYGNGVTEHVAKPQ